MDSLGKAYQKCMMLKYLLILALITTGIPAPASPDNGDIPVDLQAKLFLTALTYDKNLKKRADEKLEIGILYFSETSHSRKEAETFSQVLEEFKDKKISGRSFHVALLSYSDNGRLKKKIVNKHIDLLYIAQGEKNLVQKVLEVTQSEKILSCTSRAEYVTTYGVTMAVGLKDNKPKIYLNLSSAKREGADFSAKFLRVAEIVEKEESEDRSQK
jgi:hypothetical protein